MQDEGQRGHSPQQIFYCKAQGVRIPVRLEVFKHGGGVCVAVTNHDENINIPLIAPAPAMVARLREAADLIEAAVGVRDQGHVSREGNGHTPAPRVAPAAPNWDWLTPEMVIKYVEQSPVLHIYAEDVRAALKPLVGMTQTASVESQLELDLEAVRPHLARITLNGKVNKSEIARLLGIRPSGPGNWARLTEIADFISSSSFSPTPRPAISDEKKRSAAA